MIKIAPQAKIFQRQNTYSLKWQIFTQFNISIFGGQKRSAGEIFLKHKFIFVKMQVFNIFGGYCAPQATFFEMQNAFLLKCKFFRVVPDIRPFLYSVSGRISGFICRISGQITGYPVKLLNKSVSGTTLKFLQK